MQINGLHRIPIKSYLLIFFFFVCVCVWVLHLPVCILERCFSDTTAAEDQRFNPNNILENCQLILIVYDSFNLCSLNASNGFKRLSVNMLRMMCEYFYLDIANIPRSWKAPYMQLLSNLVQTCSCVSSGQ